MIAGETEVLGENLVPPQIPHDQVRFRAPDRSGGKPTTNRLSYGVALAHAVTPLNSVHCSIFDRTPTVLMENIRNFPQSLQANTGIVPQNRPRPLTSMSSSIYHSRIGLPFETAYFKLVTRPLNKNICKYTLRL
jgi:hypothetical protein